LLTLASVALPEYQAVVLGVSVNDKVLLLAPAVNLIDTKFNPV